MSYVRKTFISLYFDKILRVVHEWSWVYDTALSSFSSVASFLPTSAGTPSSSFQVPYSSFQASCSLSSAQHILPPSYMWYFIQSSAQLSPWQSVLFSSPLSKVVSHLAPAGSTLVFNCNHHLTPPHTKKLLPLRCQLREFKSLRVHW